MNNIQINVGISVILKEFDFGIFIFILKPLITLEKVKNHLNHLKFLFSFFCSVLNSIDISFIAWKPFKRRFWSLK